MIPIALPLLGDEEAEAAREAVLSGWVSQGPQVAAFERDFAALVGAPYACAVSNCTTALHLALVALDVGPGDEVITASHSFIATANCVRYCGATPVFVDIDPDTYNIDPDRVAEAITSRTRAIIAVHQMGMPCDLAALVAIADRHGIALIEDAACAAGSQIRMNGGWDRIGKPHGRIACFSFHPRKVITTGEGGMLTTSDPELDRKFRLLRQHGMSVPDTVRHGSPQVIFEDYLAVGFNYRMTDIQAAVGRKQLDEAVRYRGAPPGSRRALCGIARQHRRAAPAIRAGVGPLQLAELLRASAGPGRPESRHAEPSRSGHRDTTWHHVLAPRGAVFECSARHDSPTVRTRPGSVHFAADLRADERARSHAGCRWADKIALIVVKISSNSRRR